MPLLSTRSQRRQEHEFLLQLEQRLIERSDRVAYLFKQAEEDLKQTVTLLDDRIARLEHSMAEQKQRVRAMEQRLDVLHGAVAQACETQAERFEALTRAVTEKASRIGHAERQLAALCQGNARQADLQTQSLQTLARVEERVQELERELQLQQCAILAHLTTAQIEQYIECSDTEQEEVEFFRHVLRRINDQNARTCLSDEQEGRTPCAGSRGGSTGRATAVNP